MSYVIGSTRTCLWCGKAYKVRASTQRYCSPDCKRLAQIQRARDWHAAHPLPDKICLNCGRAFRPLTTRQKYCSRQCAGRTRPGLPPVETEPETVRIRILRDIPIRQEMQPIKGRIYEAEPSTYRLGAASFWIIRVNGHKVIVRTGEAIEV